MMTLGEEYQIPLTESIRYPSRRGLDTPRQRRLPGMAATKAAIYFAL